MQPNAMASSPSGQPAQPSIINQPIHLTTIHAGHVYQFDGRDPFIQVCHQVVECTAPPPVILSIGLMVIIEGIEGKLKEVYGTKKRKIRFVFQPNNHGQAYMLLEVCQQFAKLPWHWKAWLRVCQLGRMEEREDLGIEIM
jgi:hypothetical protein